MNAALGWLAGAVAALFAAFGLLIDLNLLFRGDIAHFIVAVIILAFFVLPTVVVSRAFMLGAWRRGRNSADGVILAWDTLRLTKTELIEGYSRSAPRHPLAGLTARVDNSGAVISKVSGGGYVGEYGSVRIRTTTKDQRLVHLTVEGPSTAIVRTVKLKHFRKADARAREFASAVNVAGRQLQGAPRPSPGAPAMPSLPSVGGNYHPVHAYPVFPPPPPPPSVPAGWYPDPGTGDFQRYWDGTGWTAHTAPRV